MVGEVPGLDSIDLWPSLATPRASSTNRTELALAFCDAAAQCDDAEAAGWVRRARSAPRLDQDDERLVSAEACARVILL